MWGLFGDISKTKTFEERKRFGAHLDVITAMNTIALNQEQLVITAAEDCLIKIWDSAKIVREDAPEPKFTLRKHTGPLFALASCPHP